MKTKAAKAAEFAISLKKEQDTETANNTIGNELPVSTSDMSSKEMEAKIKDLEKRITKQRNENQE